MIWIRLAVQPLLSCRPITFLLGGLRNPVDCPAGQDNDMYIPQVCVYTHTHVYIVYVCVCVGVKVELNFLIVNPLLVMEACDPRSTKEVEAGRFKVTFSSAAVPGTALKYMRLCCE